MKHSKKITDEISSYIESGSNQRDAATLAGIGETTFYEWMRKSEFSESIKKALLKCKHRNIKIIQKAAQTTWTAAAWWLERRHPEEFGLKYKHESPKDPEEKSEMFKKLSLEDLKKLVKLSDKES